MVMPKLTAILDFFLFGRAGQIIALLFMIFFCMMIAAACLLVGREIDKSELEQTSFDQAVEYIAL